MKTEDIIILITGQLTSEEKKEVLEWIMASPEHREEYYRLKNLWALTSQSNLSLKSEERELEKFQEIIRHKKTKFIKSRILTFARYAAVVTVAFFVGKFVFQRKEPILDKTVLYNEITVPPGQMAQLTLSEGTSVYINSCSKLKYPAEFKPGDRRVFLEGEAYFSVTKNQEPFFVETSNRIVKVLGTKFNVMAYPNDKSYQTTLMEGKITLLDTAGNELVGLKPGEQYFLDIKTNKSTLKTVKTNIYDSWKDGLYIFDHESLEGLTERLERIYAVRIMIKNEKIKNYKFTGTISRNAPFEQILKIIQISAPIKYKLKKSNGAIEEIILY